MAATHLADTTALLELHEPIVAARIGPLLIGGQIATCGPVDLELLGLVRGADRLEVVEERRVFPRVPCGDNVFDRAIEVQALVGDPSPSTLDLVVAAVAELAGMVLLHNSDAFEQIAAVTGQPTERVVP